MCGRITLTRPNLESIAAELDVEPMNYRGYPIMGPHYFSHAPVPARIVHLVHGGRNLITPKNRY